MSLMPPMLHPVPPFIVAAEASGVASCLRLLVPSSILLFCCLDTWTALRSSIIVLDNYEASQRGKKETDLNGRMCPRCLGSSHPQLPHPRTATCDDQSKGCLHTAPTTKAAAMPRRRATGCIASPLLRSAIASEASDKRNTLCSDFNSNRMQNKY
nr:uncharacterized protein LOC117848588 isoform X2 [Setaria viridis]